MKHTRIALVAIAALILTGCAAQPETRTITDSQRESYLTEIRRADPELGMFGDHDDLVRIGESFCILRDQGSSNEDGMAVLRESGMDDLQAVLILGAAVRSFCPEHSA